MVPLLLFVVLATIASSKMSEEQDPEKLSRLCRRRDTSLVGICFEYITSYITHHVFATVVVVGLLWVVADVLESDVIEVMVDFGGFADSGMVGPVLCLTI